MGGSGSEAESTVPGKGDMIHASAPHTRLRSLAHAGLPVLVGPRRSGKKGASGNDTTHESSLGSTTRGWIGSHRPAAPVGGWADAECGVSGGASKPWSADYFAAEGSLVAAAVTIVVF